MENIHSTRLKEKILSRIPELHESKKGRDVVLTFKDEVGSAIYKDCKQDFEEDGICLSSAANIVRKQIFQHIQATEKFSLEEGSQNTSVPRSLVTLKSTIIGGSSISGNVSNAESKIALNISQLILFNVVKHKRRKANELDKLRHSAALETPFPLFTGFLKEEVFTTAAVDNIDHDPSSTTATKSFHGTSISIFQHVEKALEPNQIDLSVDFEDSSTKIELPESYTNLSPTKSKAAEYPLQTVNRENSSYLQPMDEMDDWLEHLMQMNGKDDDIKNRFSWSGFHSKKSAIRAIKTTSTLLPLLNESVNSTAMLRHTIGVVKQILLKINPQQPIVLTAYQPVYALGKQVQWMYPEFYGESNVVMMGAFHIEMAFLNTIGDWLEGSGWVEVLAKAEVNTPGRAESFLSGKQVKRSRYAHQMSCSALYLLVQDAYTRSETDLSFDTWLLKRSKESVQFHVLEQVSPWLFSLDHTHYSRWLPIFIQGMKQLSCKHPLVYQEFNKGHFTVKNSTRKFSGISEDQAHKQNNKLVKIDGGAIGILDNHTSMMKWIIAGREISRILRSFEVEEDRTEEDAPHQEDTDSHEKCFGTDLTSFKSTIDCQRFEKGNLNRVDVVFDRYFPESLKTDTREKRGHGTRISVKETTPICKNWRQFLRASGNKKELFSLLAKQLELSGDREKVIVATSGEGVKCSSPMETESLCPSNHEEADTRIFLHAKHATASGHRLITIRTVDTDVVVIAIHVFRSIIWGQSLERWQNIPDVNQFGCIRNNDAILPKWSLLPEASKACHELVKCGCKRKCESRCKCKQHHLQCTDLCQCGGECR
ncbi:hypothetical protein ROHU_037104 [Paramuricea clavata]|uniref:Uncharacterized protein n=1 Tax=Paramuricea clavata TaxID=317549 RepID=A0A6S7KYE7_PARCT|nr:hypothetical protein ROHU_037104 [Paramuricea clavata]